MTRLLLTVTLVALGVHCAPRAAQAACRNGRCIEEQLGGPRP